MKHRKIVVVFDCATNWGKQLTKLFVDLILCLFICLIDSVDWRWNRWLIMDNLADIDDEVWKAERRANYPRLGKEKSEQKSNSKGKERKKKPISVNLYDKVCWEN